MNHTMFRSFHRWSLLAAGMVLLQSLGARAQEFADGSTVAPATQVTFSFVQTPDISAISSLAADSENDIWATSPLASVALHFDGTQWKKLAMVNSGRIAKVAVLSTTNVWAVGQQTNSTFSQIQHFNGSKWAVVPSPHFKSGETLSSLKAISADSIFAVGRSIDSLNNRIPLIEHFNGTAWSAVAAPHISGGELFDITVVSPTDIWAVGDANNSSLIMHFDGSTWKQVPAAGGSVGLFAVTAVSAKNVWAVGAQTGIGAVIEHWNGTAWKVVANPAGVGTLLNSVSAISATDVWAAGCISCGDVGFDNPPLIEHWDGKQWTINSAPIKNGGLAGTAILTFPSRHIYVGGFVFANSGPASFIMKAAEGQ